MLEGQVDVRKADGLRRPVGIALGRWSDTLYFATSFSISNFAELTTL